MTKATQALHLPISWSSIGWTAILVAVVWMFASCDKDEDADPILTFVGDSEVELWDTKFFFPSYNTTNKGKSGAVLADIEKLENIAQGTYAIVILGTNDIPHLSSETIADYAERYVMALERLNGIRTFVFSIFPRGFEGEKSEANRLIRQLNTVVEQKCLSRSSFTYIDVYAALEKGDGINPEYSFDGLHLSKQGYELITGELKKKI